MRSMRTRKERVGNEPPKKQKLPDIGVESGLANYQRLTDGIAMHVVEHWSAEIDKNTFTRNMLDLVPAIRSRITSDEPSPETILDAALMAMVESAPSQEAAFDALNRILDVVVKLPYRERDDLGIDIVLTVSELELEFDRDAVADMIKKVQESGGFNTYVHRRRIEDSIFQTVPKGNQIRTICEELYPERSRQLEEVEDRVRKGKATLKEKLLGPDRDDD